MVNKIQQFLKRTNLLSILLVLGLLLIGLGIRLYDLTDQPIDFHSTRQLRAGIITRGMYYEMLPNADPEIRELTQSFWRSTGQLEPSILERIVAVTYLLAGGEYLWISRIYTSLFWIIGGIALFALARRMSPFTTSSERRCDETGIKTAAFGAALFTLAYYLLLQFGVQASRSFQPDPGMVMGIILAVYALYRWSEKRAWKWAIAAGIAAGITVLVKTFAGYVIAGAAVSIVLSTFAANLLQTDQTELSKGKRALATLKQIISSTQVWVMVILMVLPTLIYYFSRGERASEYFTTWTLSLSHLLLQPSFYMRWLNLIQNLMGLMALVLALLGVLLSKSRNRALLLGLWIGYLVYGLFVPYQMYSHTYYHLMLIPIVALSLAPVIETILIFLFSPDAILQKNKIWRVVFVGILLIGLVSATWTAVFPQYSQDYRNEPAYWQQIASYLPTQGKIIGLTQDYGYRLMYYGWRKVTLWPNRGEQNLSILRGSEKEFEDYFEGRTENKSYFLITSFNQFNDQPTLKEFLYDNYPILAEGDGYLIFDLGKPLKENFAPH